MTISATTQGLRMGVATSTSRPTVPFDGQVISETDTDLLKVYNGTAWVSAGGMTLLSTTTLTGASTTISSIDQTYTALQIYIENAYSSVTTGYVRCYINGDSTSANYTSSTNRFRSGASTLADDTYTFAGWAFYNSTASNFISVNLPNYASSTVKKAWSTFGTGLTDTSQGAWNGSGQWNSTAAISSLQFINSAGAWSAGTVKIYGVK